MAALIEPWLARAVARRVAGESDLDDPRSLERLRTDLSRSVAQSEELVAEASGIAAPSPVAWGVVDRATWAEANISAMTQLLGPLGDKIAQRLEGVPAPMRVAQRGLVSVEIGVLLGYLSRRVLGQYDLLVSGTSRVHRRALQPAGAARPRSGTSDGALYFVGINLLETERRWRFVPEDFALWVVLHEVTHRFQFAGVPWLRDRFLGLVHSYLDSLDMDARGLAARLGNAVKRLVAREVPPEERNPAYLLSSEEQRQILDELQALMAVIEGHGNFVMDSVGAKVIPSFARMRSVFEQRRAQQSAFQRVLNQAIGLEMKLRQYELGQRFCEAVVARGGLAALSSVWAAPSHLPSLNELREPELWLKRVA